MLDSIVTVTPVGILISSGKSRSAAMSMAAPFSMASSRASKVVTVVAADAQAAKATRRSISQRYDGCVCDLMFAVAHELSRTQSVDLHLNRWGSPFRRLPCGNFVFSSVQCEPPGFLSMSR